MAGWLRSLARELHRETGGPGVGVVGMCFTGGFALATMVDPDEGTVTARVDSLDDQLETMAQRISDFEDRMDAYRTRLERQVTAMEVAMARIQSAQSALTALLPDTKED